MSSTSSSPEKVPTALETIQIHESNEALEGYVLDPSHYAGDASALKTSADGLILIPQPLDTKDDPLNWSSGRKWAIVAIVAYIAALADYTGGTAIITVIPQSLYVKPRRPISRCYKSFPYLQYHVTRTFISHLHTWMYVKQTD